MGWCLPCELEEIASLPRARGARRPAEGGLQGVRLLRGLQDLLQRLPPHGSGLNGRCSVRRFEQV